MAEGRGVRGEGRAVFFYAVGPGKAGSLRPLRGDRRGGWLSGNRADRRVSEVVAGGEAAHNGAATFTGDGGGFDERCSSWVRGAGGDRGVSRAVRGTSSLCEGARVPASDFVVR